MDPAIQISPAAYPDYSDGTVKSNSHTYDLPYTQPAGDCNSSATSNRPDLDIRLTIRVLSLFRKSVL